MAKKILQVIENIYRATTEEQDDTVLWLSQAMNKAGANCNLLLSGNGTLYGVDKSPSPPLTIGNWRQTQPADVSRDIRTFISTGGKIYIVDEDCIARGIERHELLSGLHRLARNEIANLYHHFDLVFHW